MKTNRLEELVRRIFPDIKDSSAIKEIAFELEKTRREVCES